MPRVSLVRTALDVSGALAKVTTLRTAIASLKTTAMRILHSKHPASSKI